MGTRRPRHPCSSTRRRRIGGQVSTESTLPSDPFSGKPLRYRASAQGFVLYNVGENGKDDGGSDEEETIVKDGSKTTRVKDMTVETFS